MRAHGQDLRPEFKRNPQVWCVVCEKEVEEAAAVAAWRQVSRHEAPARASCALPH